MRRLALPISLPVVVLVGVALVAGSGCSSGSGSKSSSSTTLSPEDVLVSNAKAAEGLKSLGLLAASASKEVASGASAAAKSTVDQAWDQWLAIEGRVKQNDTGAYLEFEDALSDLRIGADEQDSAKLKQGATAIGTLVAAYVVKFPG